MERREREREAVTVYGGDITQKAPKFPAHGWAQIAEEWEELTVRNAFPPR